MRRHLLFVLAALAFVVGCRSTGGSSSTGRSWLADWVLPGDSEFDKSRRFWDQTSDNPYR